MKHKFVTIISRILFLSLICLWNSLNFTMDTTQMYGSSQEDLSASVKSIDSASESPQNAASSGEASPDTMSASPVGSSKGSRDSSPGFSQEKLGRGNKRLELIVTLQKSLKEVDLEDKEAIFEQLKNNSNILALATLQSRILKSNLPEAEKKRISSLVSSLNLNSEARREATTSQAFKLVNGVEKPAAEAFAESPTRPRRLSYAKVISK